MATTVIGSGNPSGGGTEYLPLTGGAMKDNINMQYHRITNLAEPISSSDSATVSYVTKYIHIENETGVTANIAGHSILFNKTIAGHQFGSDYMFSLISGKLSSEDNLSFTIDPAFATMSITFESEIMAYLIRKISSAIILFNTNVSGECLTLGGTVEKNINNTTTISFNNSTILKGKTITGITAIF